MEIKTIEKTRRKNMKENIHVLIKRSGETRGKNKTKIKLLLKVSRPFFSHFVGGGRQGVER
jgi:hypothetical protein